MIEIDPNDGLPVDLDAAMRELAEQRERQEAEDRAEFAHLYSGEWLTTADALAMLISRGSIREDAAASLLMWLRTNDGQAPHLRARAQQARRMLRSSVRNDSTVSRDCIVHAWDWSEDVRHADWGSGTFVLADREKENDHAEGELQLIGVTVSKDDLVARLSPTAVSRGKCDSASREPSAIPPVATPARTGDPGRPSLSRDLYMAELQARIERGEITASSGPAEVARKLLQWIRAKHPAAAQPQLKTIENRIRDELRALKIPPK